MGWILSQLPLFFKQYQWQFSGAMYNVSMVKLHLKSLMKSFISYHLIVSFRIIWTFLTWIKTYSTWMKMKKKKWCMDLLRYSSFASMNMHACITVLVFPIFPSSKTKQRTGVVLASNIYLVARYFTYLGILCLDRLSF